MIVRLGVLGVLVVKQRNILGFELFEAQIGKGRGLSAETNRDTFVVGDDRKAVLPDQLLEAGHLIRLTAEIDLPIRDSSPVEVLAQCPAMRTSVGCKNENGVERCHPIQPTIPVLSFTHPTRDMGGEGKFRIPNSSFLIVLGSSFLIFSGRVVELNIAEIRGARLHLAEDAGIVPPARMDLDT